MATLTIVRKKQRIYHNKPVSIYLNRKKIGLIQNGHPVSFQVGEGTHLISSGKGFFKSQGTRINTMKQQEVQLELSVHPAVQLLYLTLAVSLVFVALVFLLFTDRLNALLAGLLLVPLIVLLVLGMIFLRKHFFVLRKSGE